MIDLIKNARYTGEMTDAQGRVVRYYITDHYDDFQYFDENREVIPAKVKQLAMSLENNVEHHVVFVSEEGKVGDGQYTIAASRRLGLPVTFAVIPGITPETIRNWNSTMNPWSLRDHLHAGSADNLAYKWLETFCATHNLHVTIALVLLRGSAGYQPGLMQEIRTGKFTCTKEERVQANARLKILDNFAEYPKYRTKNFVTALLRILDVSHLDHARLYESFSKRHALDLPKAALSPEAFQYKLQEMYNYRLPKEKKLRFLSATESDRLAKRKV